MDPSGSRGADEALSSTKDLPIEEAELVLLRKTVEQTAAAKVTIMVMKQSLAGTILIYI